MVGSNVLIEVASLLGPVRAIGALELWLLATLVPGMSDQGSPMLVAFAAGLASIGEVHPLGHPQGRQVLDGGHDGVAALPLVALWHAYTWHRD